MKELKLSSGESIYIFDNVLNYEEVRYIENSVQFLNYRVIPVDMHQSRSRNGIEKFFGAILNQEELNKLGILSSSGLSKIYEKFFYNRSIFRAWVLCNNPSTKHLFHVDNTEKGCTTLLYYINSFWDREWGGETLFCNSSGTPEIAVECVPNRVVVFPGNVYHKPAQTTLDSNPFRFTLTITFL